MIYVLLFYIAIVVTYIAIPKQEKKQKKVSRVAYSKSNYSTPLKTYKEYDQFKDKKSNLYVPRKQKGRGVEIENDKG